MINITYDKRAHRLEMNGHADYAPIGSDIVCAAVSTLCYTFAQEIENLGIDERNIDIGSGYSVIECKPNKQNKAVYDVVAETILTGLKMIAKEYPDNVNINIK